MKESRLALLVLNVVWFGCVPVFMGCTQTACVTLSGSQTVTFKVEIADSTLKQVKGLMFRKKLDRDEGMLFVYRDSQPRCFWMKNTRIPVDILFIREDRRIVNVTEADPCKTSRCERYCSKDKVKYVLEINQGLSRAYGFAEGTRVSIHREDV